MQVKKKDGDKKEEKSENVFAPFKALVGGFKELVGVSRKDEKGGKVNPGEKDAAEKMAKLYAYLIYNIYKKTHGMMTE